MTQKIYSGVSTQHNNYIAPLAMFFYMILLSASVAGQKLIPVFGFVVSAGSIIFPITYMTIACITEIYGLSHTKRIIFTGAVCNIIVSLYLYFVVNIPHADFWHNQTPFRTITTTTIIILLTSTAAYVVSEYINAKILSKLKVLLKGKWLLSRAIASTSIAAIVDSTLMLPVIFYNSPNQIFIVYFSLVILKVTYEIVLLPFFWLLVEFLKKKEGIYNNDVQAPFSSVSYMLQEKNRK